MLVAVALGLTALVFASAESCRERGNFGAAGSDASSTIAVSRESFLIGETVFAAALTLALSCAGELFS